MTGMNDDINIPQGDWLETEKKTEKKKKKKKPNVADLDSHYQKSREALMHFRPQRKERVRQSEIKADGTRILPELPIFLQGFDDYTKGGDKNTIEEKSVEHQQTGRMDSIDSVKSRLHVMRKLTDRMIRGDSPEKTVSLVKKKTTMATQQSDEAELTLCNS
jgi:hypothetical protein